MFLVPGWLVAILTFPGIIVHEVSHLVACRVLGVPVLKVCYFRFGNPAGYVIHEKPDSVYKSLMIAVGPFIFNSIVGAAIAAPGALPLLRHKANTPLGYALIWLGFSILMHSFPSTGDAKAMWQAMWSKGSPILAKLVGTPLVLLIYLGALGSVFWLDAIYGAAVIFVAARVLVRLL